MSPAITVRQQLAQRPGSQYGTESRSLSFGLGSMFSFALYSTSYEADAATIRIPGGIKLRLSSASVDRKEMSDFLRVTTGGGKTAMNGGGVALKFSSEENGDMIPICTFDGERGGDLHQTGLGIEVEGPRIVRLAAVIERTCKVGSTLNVNVFGSVFEGDL
ncbi:hypothetical protein ACHAXA_009942 [Cyclostephanos tholiformis]|uniref:Uncharacterized protein n=1 Tax=Cyclostephanos tholiformis TaxID=382380 RepID=A0ABD3RY31_9STRA